MPTGPITVASFAFDSGRPSGVQIPPAAPQSVVAAIDTVTSADDHSRTLILQRWFWFGATRAEPTTRPFVACGASSLSLW